jgi:RHS repeat-associated protein
VATIQPSGSSVEIYYIETNQLNTPRVVVRPSDNALMWTWFSGPFGIEAPNTNPQGAGAFTYDLRFPGQIAGAWGSTFQNDNRDYDPAVGRYIESDPIGLAGSNYSTYGYVLGNPILNIDPLGLCDEKQNCEELQKIDIATCRAIGRRRGKAAAAACYASANQRYAACLSQGESLCPR